MIWRARYSPLDERTREGDDHPARLFLRLLTDRDEKGAMEVIWGNRLQPGDCKYLRSFPHFVADAGDERVGHWLDERIDLARVYAEIWKDAVPAHLVDVAVFCDSDDTASATSAMSDSNEARTFQIETSPMRVYCLTLNQGQPNGTDRRFSDRAHRDKT
jgi:hypothetical protein